MQSPIRIEYLKLTDNLHIGYIRLNNYVNYNHSSSVPRTLHPYMHADRHGPGSAGALYKNSI